MTAEMNRDQATIQSFDYQWSHLPNGDYLLSDKMWRRNVVNYILDELQWSRRKLRNKLVLDAGCGSGRWAYGFLKLGCLVYGFDTSRNALDHANNMRVNENRGYFWNLDILNKTALLNAYKPEKAELIWCWGVLHHTSEPKRGFLNLVELLKPGGAIHLYLYGKKSPANKLWRMFFNLFSFSKREFLAKEMAKLIKATQKLRLRTLSYPLLPFSSSTHSNFDAYSPSIASSHTEKEVREWFREAGLSFTCYTPRWARKSRDLFVTGVKK